MLRELTEYGKKNKGRNEGYLSEIKNNPQETNREGEEARIQTNILEHKKEIHIQPEQKEETRIQKKEDRPRNLWDISQSANI